MEKLPSLKKNKYETNPFLIDLKGRMFLQPRANTIVAKGQSLVDTNTGEILKEEQVLLGKRKIVDKSQFAKLYASEIGVLYELSGIAKNVFLYLTKVMDYDNKAYLNYNVDFKKIKNKDRFYKTGRGIITALRELISKDIIASTHMVHWYWLNPTIVCKGERFAKYTEFILDKTLEVSQGEIALKKQGKEHFDIMDSATDGKISAMNKKGDGIQLNIFDAIAEAEKNQLKKRK